MTLQLIFHGILLIIVGMLMGFPFTAAITESWGEEAVGAWRVAHTSLILAGGLYLAIAAVAQHLVLSRRSATAVTGCLLGTAYGFLLAFVIGPPIGARGLEPTGPALHVAVFFLLVVSLVSFFVAIGILLQGAWSGLRAASSE